jgi:hypothetical protein
MAETYPQSVPESTRKELCECFNEIHWQFEAVKDRVEALNDPNANALYKRMEVGCLAPMRKIRLYLGVPYKD